MSVAIRVEGVSKKYKLGALGRASLSDELSRWWEGRRARTASRDHSNASSWGRDRGELWALRDVTFDLDQGQVLGVVGSNGAGKSTLLKLLARITSPTCGEIRMRGRAGSLLEVGTGFHPDLTGRENLYLNGTILGMTKREVDRKFDEIVDFSGVERFIDTPVKRYSSGMQVRLAFAVAAHLDPEILIIDEVLAVGDASFQKRCLGKMGEVARAGRTVLFVSHNMAAVRNLCSSAILLESGSVVRTGAPSDVIADYLSRVESSNKGELSWAASEQAPGDSELRVRALRVLNRRAEVSPIVDIDEDVTVEIIYEVLEPLHNARVGFQLLDPDGTIIFETGCGDEGDLQGTTVPSFVPGLYRSACTIPALLLNSGHYHIRLAGHIPQVRFLFRQDVYLSMTVAQTVEFGGFGRRPGLIRPLLRWSTSEMPTTNVHDIASSRRAE